MTDSTYFRKYCNANQNWKKMSIRGKTSIERFRQFEVYYHDIITHVGYARHRKALAMFGCRILQFELCFLVSNDFYMLTLNFFTTSVREGWSRLVRIPALHAGDHGFKSHSLQSKLGPQKHCLLLSNIN